jgi:sulfur-oxidizing protein SoxA
LGVNAAFLAVQHPVFAAEPTLRRSSTLDLSPETRSMQEDDALNPATFWRLDGEVLWQTPVGASGRSCASCHSNATDAMRGVAVQFPKLVSGALLNLEAQINRCRTVRQGQEPFPFESNALLSMAVFIGAQSRGLPISPVVSSASTDTDRESNREAGRRLFERRIGQLNLACVHCHDERAGARLGGNVIPQAHPTGYPIYRLEWNTVGSLQRRLRNCMTGVRAEPFPFGSVELIQLELYLMERARGMVLETPGVRP